MGGCGRSRSKSISGAQGIIPNGSSPALAAKLNDQLAAAISRHPGRLAGFAALPTASPAEAADELERAVRDLGFVGGLVNSTLVFDRHPGLKLTIGYCGEMIPFMLARIDEMMPSPSVTGLDALPVSPAEKAKIAGENAERLLRL
jgi:predicted TIM-barrel fold metal-dependent hydrolase